MFERLAATITGLSKTIDSITVQEFADCSKVPTPEMLFDLMGMGKDPSEIRADNPMYREISLQYEQAIHSTADVLGVEIERIDTAVDTAVIDHDVELSLGTVRAGTVVGQVLKWTGYRDDAPFLIAEEYWVVTKDIPQWDLSVDDAPFIRIVVEGMPRLRLDLAVEDVPVPGLPGTIAGHLLVGMTAAARAPVRAAGTTGRRHRAGVRRRAAAATKRRLSGGGIPRREGMGTHRARPPVDR